MKIVTVLGARPQFIKAASVSRNLSDRKGVSEIIVHTGQHYDANMSDVFFDQLKIPRPVYNLKISNLSHGAMTGRMLGGIEEILVQESPDWVLVYGDTNSTLAGALAASKLHLPVAHVEAGLRSFNPYMPEEINRILVDRVSNLLLCPSESAINNLLKEGYPFSIASRGNGMHLQKIEAVGDVMFDSLINYKDQISHALDLNELGIGHRAYALCTLHRQENTENNDRFFDILAALREIAKELPVVVPMHPRTRAKISEGQKMELLFGLDVIEPLPYLQMQSLVANAKLVLTDSGGLQKEAYFHGVPCITLREETEWIETVQTGWNQVAGVKREGIRNAYSKANCPKTKPGVLYGDGTAAAQIVDLLLRYTHRN